MLGNLIKYEIQATRRIFLPLYGLILVFAIINKIFLSANFNKMEGFAAIPFWITMMIYVLLIAALFVMTLVVLIQRFQKNLLSDEGYLSFTLPVKTHLHLDSKILVTVMWMILSLIVAFLSIFLLAFSSDSLQWMREQWPRFISQLEPFGGAVYGILAEGLVFALLLMAKETVHIYLSIAVGNFSSKHKLLAAFGMFIGLNVVEQIITSLLMTAGVKTSFFQNIHVSLIGGAAIPVIEGLLGVSIAYTLVFGGIYYFFTHLILSKKLNLE